MNHDDNALLPAGQKGGARRANKSFEISAAVTGGSSHISLSFNVQRYLLDVDSLLRMCPSTWTRDPAWDAQLQTVSFVAGIIDNDHLGRQWFAVPSPHHICLGGNTVRSALLRRGITTLISGRFFF